MWPLPLFFSVKSLNFSCFINQSSLTKSHNFWILFNTLFSEYASEHVCACVAVRVDHGIFHCLLMWNSNPRQAKIFAFGEFSIPKLTCLGILVNKNSVKLYLETENLSTCTTKGFMLFMSIESKTQQVNFDTFLV